MMNAEVRVGGRRVDPGTVLFDEWHFGRTPSPPLPLHTFTLVADEEAFLARFQPMYDRVMDEYRRDDEAHGFEPLYDGAIRHPALEELFFSLPHRHRMTVLDLFGFDILRFYVNAPDDRLRWVGASIDDIRLMDGKLHIKGLVRRPVRQKHWLSRWRQDRISKARNGGSR